MTAPSNKEPSNKEPADKEPGFAPDDDAPIGYMARTRDYYAAIGYTTPYRWAHYTGAPFEPLRKPLKESRVTIITTAAPHQPAKGDQGPGAQIQCGREILLRLLTAIPRTSRPADLPRRHRPQAHHGRGQRHLVPAAAAEAAAPQPAASAQSHRAFTACRPTAAIAPPRDDARKSWRAAATRCVDAAVLVPNCPVCHQTVSLVARHLEANGIPPS